VVVVPYLGYLLLPDPRAPRHSGWLAKRFPRLERLQERIGLGEPHYEGGEDEVFRTPFYNRFRALVDACLASAGRARGVATVKRSVSDEELQQLHAAGVRGVRFNFVKRLVDFTPKDELLEIAGRIAKLGWHVVIYFEAVDLPELWDFFTQLPTTVVVDHMGRPDVSKGVDSAEFALFLQFMRQHPNVWSKVSCPERLSLTGPKALAGEQAAYRDVVPFARRVVEEFPDRVLWGTDWPHPNLKDHMPDDGLLVDFIPHIAPTAQLQRKLLVDNPMRLYWPEEAGQTP
jgi:2-pyrone-4,6-dicarboxylate lactonase